MSFGWQVLLSADDRKTLLVWYFGAHSKPNVRRQTNRYRTLVSVGVPAEAGDLISPLR